MEPKQEHKLISRADILLIVGIMILTIAGLFVWKKLQKPGAYVDILIDGTSVKTLQLDKDASYEVMQYGRCAGWQCDCARCRLPG